MNYVRNATVKLINNKLMSIIKLERIILCTGKDMEIEQHMKIKTMEQQILDQKIIIENMTKNAKNT